MKQKYVVMVVVVLVACIAAETLLLTNWTDFIENIYYDVWHQLAGLRIQPEHTAIVVIDDVALLEHKDEPLVFWGPYFARAIDVLRTVGTAVIGVDFLFLVSAESWIKRLKLPENEISRTYDIPMRAQLAQGQVVLAGLLAVNKDGEGEYLLPLIDYIAVLPEQLADVGLTNLHSDADGVVRHFVPAFFERDRLPNLSFATLLAVKAAGLNPGSADWRLGGINIPNAYDIRRIGFVGPPQSIPRISFSKLLSPHAATDPEVQELKDKIVIIAAEYTGIQDTHLTPYSRPFLGFEGEVMISSELLANIVETLLTGRFPRTIPLWLQVLYLAVVLSLATVLFFTESPWSGVGIGVLIGILCPIPAYVLFHYDFVLPVAHIQLALLLSYLGSLGFRLTGEERERVRLRQTFGRFVSDEVVEHLIATGTTPDLGGESVQITVLFADIRNFTTISEQLPPPEVVEMLNEYFSRICEPIIEQGGMINKFIGDAVMAVFGAPASFPDHSERALRTALTMKKVTEDFQKWMQKRFPDLSDFRIGIGVHTGEAVMGNIGSAKRMEYTAIGDTVNTASRLEEASKNLEWTIVTSTDTVREVSSNVQTRGHDKIHVKGREKPVEVFEVIGLTSEELTAKNPKLHEIVLKKGGKS